MSSSEVMTITRLHSSSLLTVSPSMHCAGGCAWSQGVPAPGGGGSTWSWGVYAIRGVVSQHALRQIPPVNCILDTRY